MGDSLTIESAIKHAEEVAEEKERDARFYTFSRPYNYRKESSEKCAAKHRQLARWLKDYKRLLEREPCEDAISRAEAIRIASGYCYYTNIPKELEKLPAVQPEPKTGRWIFVDKAHEHAHCSECDYGNVDLLNGRPHNYCTNCGCCMVEPQESEDKE